jgi:glycosyltransferase involved in cell wall biosynthesis
MSTPLISIITPSYNRAAMIADAVESVLAQDYPAFEHIIIDGASTDNTLDILARYPHLKVVSKPDRGMYDAINKGIGMAHGDILAWLNTDDLYPPGAFSVVAEVFTSHPDALAVSGKAETYEERDGRQHLIRSEEPIDDKNFWRRIVEAPVPNGWFFHRSVFEKVGQFDPAFRYVGDRHLIIRVALQGIQPVPIYYTLYHYRQHPGSATFHTDDSRHPILGPRRMEVNQEDLRMMAGFLSNPNLPQEARFALRRANSEYAYRMAATAIYHHRWDLMLTGIRAGFRYNILFPFAFARYALRRVLKGNHG